MTIRDEIKQTIPFSSPNQEAIVALLRTANQVNTFADKIVQREGITGPQYNVLRVLRGARGPLSTYEVGKRLVEHNPGISRMMDRLEKKGLISRCRDAKDRRCVLCSITEKGLQVLTRLDNPITEFGENVFQDTRPADVAILIQALTDVRGVLRRLNTAEEAA